MKSSFSTSQIILHQRCIHHITSLCIRNLTINVPHNPITNERGQSGSFLYFTLHPNATSSQDELFKSEVVSYTPNPVWSNFNILSPDYKLSNVVVRLWIGNGDNYMPALQWQLSFNSLFCVGDSLDSSKMTFQSNSVMLGMHKSYFATSSSVTCHSHPDSSLLDTSNAKSSYSKSFLQRILSTKKESETYKSEAACIFDRAAHLRNCSNSTIISLEKEIENVKHNIGRLRSLLRRERLLLSHEKTQSSNRSLTIQLQENSLNKSREFLAEDKLKYRQSHHSFLATKKLYSQLSSQLALRRHCLLSELSLILPITVDDNSNPNSSPKKNSVSEPLLPVYRICNVRLPDSKHFRQRDDLHTSIALGYTAQIVVMISYFLLIPLRYPIVLRGSSSSILDLVTEKLSDRERVFPIWVKGKKERFLFSYGVFLLNKNIGHLRYMCGLGTSDVRRTLDNIHSLLEERPGTRLAFPSQLPSTDVNPQHCTSNNDQQLPSDDWSCRYSPGSVASSSQACLRSESSSSFSSVFQRMDSRQQELSVLRNELLGLSEVVELSPIHEPMKRSSSNVSFETNPSRKNSIDTLNRSSFLTGLERSTANVKETKLSAAEARAELFGKKPESCRRRTLKNGSVGSVNSHNSSNASSRSDITRGDSFDLPTKTQRHESCPNQTSLSLDKPRHVINQKRSLSYGEAVVNFKSADHVEGMGQSENEPDLC